MAPVSLRLPYRAPFAWDALAGFLALRAIPGVEDVTPQRYRRALRLGDAAGTIDVRPAPGAVALEAAIDLDHPEAVARAADRVRHVFDLDADPQAIGARFAADPILGPRWARLPGVRVPGAWSGFELAVRAILGQQVSVRGATTLAGRLVARFGERLDGADPALLFPAPDRLADADLRGIGLPGARARAIAGLARAVADGRLDLETPGAPDTLDVLRSLPGIGEWTVKYVAMRALRHPDAFLPTDLGVLRALADAGRRPSPRDVARRAERWRPFRAYALMLLWLG
jgi:AraC family transcriptional regulator of adaptative response / DNA-3-methyladenine glycosylase II